MRRHELTDDQFERIKGVLPGRDGYVGVTARNNRVFINAVLWIFSAFSVRQHNTSVSAPAQLASTH